MWCRVREGYRVKGDSDRYGVEGSRELDTDRHPVKSEGCWCRSGRLQSERKGTEWKKVRRDSHTDTPLLRAGVYWCGRGPYLIISGNLYSVTNTLSG